MPTLPTKKVSEPSQNARTYGMLPITSCGINTDPRSLVNTKEHVSLWLSLLAYILGDEGATYKLYKTICMLSGVLEEDE